MVTLFNFLSQLGRYLVTLARFVVKTWHKNRQTGKKKHNGLFATGGGIDRRQTIIISVLVTIIQQKIAKRAGELAPVIGRRRWAKTEID